MSIELYNIRQEEKEIAFDGVQNKLEEITNKTRQFVDGDCWVFKKDSSLKEKIIGIGEMAKRLKDHLDNNKDKNIIQGCNLCHETGNYSVFLAFKKRLNALENQEDAFKLLDVLTRKTNWFFEYLLIVLGDTDYLDFVLTHRHRSKEEEREEEKKREEIEKNELDEQDKIKKDEGRREEKQAA